MEQSEDYCMAIDFNSSGRAVYFGQLNSTLNITNRTFSAWIKLTSSIPDIYNSVISWMNDNTGGRVYIRTTPRVAFYYKFTNGPGIWEATTNLSLTTWYHVAITYNNSSTTNNPQIYINGISQSINEISTPNGALPTETGSIVIGNTYTETENYTYNFDGIIQDVRVYNRILSTNEIETLANSKCLKTVMNGLVFWAPMWGTNDQSFDGLTLTSSHQITDWVTGAVGTPIESPIGRGNTIQPLK